MTLLDFKDFSNKLYEGEGGYSPIDTYKAIAIGVSRTYALLWQLVSIGNPEFDSDDIDYDTFDDKLAKRKDYDAKWDLIISSVNKIRTILTKIPALYSLDFTKLSNLAVYAISNYKNASDILTENLTTEKISRRLKLIDDALSTDAVTLTESLIVEKKGEWVPQEGDVLDMANRLSAAIVSLRTYAQSVVQMYPKAKEYINDAIVTYINPIADKVSKILNTPMPDNKLTLSKSVRKIYRNKGWNIDDATDKRMVDMYVSLDNLEDDLIQADDKIRKGIKNINKELQGDSYATEYIDNANAKLDKIEEKIRTYSLIKDTERKKGQIIPGSSGLSKDVKKTTPDAPLVDLDQLRNHLKKKYSGK